MRQEWAGIGDFGVMEYGQKWKERRRLFHQHFNPNAIQEYKVVQQRRVREFLKDLFQEPEQYGKLTRQYVYQIIKCAGRGWLISVI